MSSNNLQAFSKIKNLFQRTQSSANNNNNNGDANNSLPSTSTNNSNNTYSNPSSHATTASTAGLSSSSLSSSQGNLSNSNSNLLANTSTKPPLEIEHEFFSTLEEHQDTMDFYKKAEKKLTDLKKTSKKMIEKEHDIATLFTDFAPKCKKNKEMSEALRKFGGNLKSTSTLLSQAMMKLDEFKDKTVEMRDEGKTISKFKSKYDSARNEYESFKLETPRVNPDKDGFTNKPNEHGEYDPQYIERTKKVEEDFKLIAKNLNNAYSDYHNELDFQLLKRDTDYFTDLKSFIYAYYCYFSTGMALFQQLDNVVKKAEEAQMQETHLSKSNGVRNIAVIPKNLFPHITADRNTVFGAPLEQVMIQDYDSGILRLPPSIKQLFDLIRAFGLDQEGVFRVNSDEQYMKKLIIDIEMGKEIQYVNKSYFVPSIAGVLKLFVRELQEPLMTFDAFQDIILNPDMQTLPNDPFLKETQVSKLKEFINNRVPIHYQVVLYELCKLLNEVSKHEDKNKMHANNLSLIFSMNLFRPRLENAVQLAQNVKHMSYVTCLLIEHFDTLFDSSLKKVCDTQNEDPYEQIRKSIAEQREDVEELESNSNPNTARSIEIKIVNFEQEKKDEDSDESDSDEESEIDSSEDVDTNSSISSPMLTFSDLPSLNSSEIVTPKNHLDRSVKYDHKHITSNHNVSLLLTPSKDQTKDQSKVPTFSPRFVKIRARNNLDNTDPLISTETTDTNTVETFSSNVTPTIVSDPQAMRAMAPPRRFIKRVEKKNSRPVLTNGENQ